MEKRKGQFEAGVGADHHPTPSGRAGHHDVTGTSNGQELMCGPTSPSSAAPAADAGSWRHAAQPTSSPTTTSGGVRKTKRGADRPAWNTGTTLPMVFIGSHRFSANWIGMFGINYERYDDDIVGTAPSSSMRRTHAGFGVGYIW